ncbi:hypothetical protein [Paenibacillus sp. GYB003]|uniref:hypothetical protein n=1 Tax=Paenibacillus sp. GYB003 TaxID=2994392 RepID=UPI002F96BE5E
MNALSFLLVSMLEWFALIVLSFTMFRIEIVGNRGQIGFTSFLLSLLSYILIVSLGLVTMATLVQPPVVFLFYWQMFRIPVFYAGLVMTNGYLAYILLTTVVFGVLQQFLPDIMPDTTVGFVAQIATACTALIVSRLIDRYRLGYTFVPHGNRVSVRFTKINARLLLFTIVGYLVMTSYNFLYFLGNYKLFVLLPVFVSLAALQYWVFRKEHTGHD